MPGKMQSRESFVAKLAVRRPDYTLLDAYRGGMAGHRFRHACGKIVTGTAVGVLVGNRRCPCTHDKHGPSGVTRKQFVADFRRVHGERFRLLSTPRDMGDKIEIACRRCGDVFDKVAGVTRREQTGVHVLKCRCDYAKTGPRRKIRDDAYWQGELDRHCGRGTYKIVKRRASVSGMCVVWHRACGETFETVLKRGMRCPCTLKKLPVMTPTSHAATLPRGFECVSFGGGKRDSEYRHECGHTWCAPWRHMRDRPHCKECDGVRGQRARITLDGLRERVAAVDDNYVVLGQLRNARVDQAGGGYMQLRHRCGHVYDAHIRAFEAAGDRCVKCYGKKPGSTKFFETGGKIYRCMGHEPQTIQRILKRWPNAKVITSRDPEMIGINYWFRHKRHKYIPDIYMPRHNMIIEVKSRATFGLVPDHHQPFGYDDMFERTQAKAKECVARGYKFVLHVYSGDRLLQLPRNWINMTKRQVARVMNINID